MATAQHYVWAGGHFILLISAFKYLLSWVLFRHPSAWWYKAAFTGALVSYAIVCQKSLGNPQPSAAWVRRALADENTQYFLLAFLWWSSRPIAVVLVPFMIFSLFHALTFTRTTIMPQFLPPGPPATEGGPPTPHPLAKRLQVWVKANYDNAMRVVAYAEVAILLRVALGALLFMNSFLIPVVFVHFVRMRYFQSPFTKESINRVIVHLDGLVNRPDVPPVVKQVYGTIQQVVGRWVGATAPARQAAPAGGR
ncbi:hypothetical protein K488DRAFT_83526 [Vararia minispora EC-137]|uniref:Uncharacterized protein n=1 Tax=Vararia minispora EC-137 TaxID=1314806 RepID=A0ACB8QTA3_9AGAM|nr:hypothetical protein K488DRAFT_83526 [Vararia minispora EC-137]